MEFSAQQIATMLNGTISGDENVKVNSLSKIEEARAGSLSFLANPKYTEYIYNTGASIVIVNSTFEAEKTLPKGCTLIRVEDAYSSFALLLEAYNSFLKPQPEISKLASVAESATIGANVHIGDYAIVGNNVTIGDNCIIESLAKIGDNCTLGTDVHVCGNVTIYRESKIGNQVTIHSGAVVGADGFGFAPSNTEGYKKVPQIGNVIIGDHCEIGANACIDRATLGSTILKEGVKIDNMVQIAHNVEIGEHTVIAAQTGVAGSTRIGKNCMIGGQVGITGHIQIADGTKIAAQSGIGNSIKEPNTIVQGTPALPIGDFKRSYVLFKGLPQMRERLINLEKKIAEIFENLTHE